MRRSDTPRSMWGLAALVLAAALVVPAPPPAVAQAPPPPPGCPEPLPVDEVRPGLRGTGRTVSRGTAVASFDVTVVDVLHDAIAPGTPLIVIEVDSPEIRRVGGIWAGMSGSPVTVGDRLLGALAYGFATGPSALAGVTPAAALYDVATRTTDGAVSPAAIAVPDRIRDLAAAEGFAPDATRSMARLPVPVGVAGPTGAVLDRFADALEAAHPGLAVTAGAATGATDVPLRAGANVGVSLSTGDVTSLALGTATAVCDPHVFAFGHPLLYEGSVELGLHGGSTVRVVADPTVAGYALVNPGPVVGRVEHDRLAGVAGRLGVLPVGTTISSTITDADADRRVAGRTDAYLHDQVDWIAQAHVALNYDLKVFDDPTVSGGAEVRWVVRGTRADGRRWTLSRSNRYASDGGLSWVATQELTDAVGQLLRNPYEDVRVTTIDYRATASRPYRAYRIDPSGFELAVGAEPFRPVTGVPTEVRPGTTLRLRVPLIAHRGPGRTVEVRMTVPADASGFGDLAVMGGADLFGQECIEGDCAAAGTDLDDLLETIAARPRADDLVLRLRLTSGEEPPGTDPALPDAETRQRLDQVVTGTGVVPVFTGGAAAACGGLGIAPFADVAPRSTHGPSIACASALGLITGLDGEPPRFDPGGLVRRDAAASVLLRTLEHLGIDVPPAPTSPRFDDLDGNVHAEAIERLAAAGILQGRAGRAYQPRAVVRRDQLASLLVATLEMIAGQPSPAAGPPPYPDVSGVHAGAIVTATERGLLTGASDGRFLPAAGTRRDQLASVMVRLTQGFGGG
ncbi:MAG TPA: S-layer homology domain-containing protein [Egicoccus sp.]|nr:S-layer homology domain-containing protein [Egicoccus sp.]HSK23847.1 S-layer homology domain-containing protein [Egicoccus sp.]